MRLTRPRLLGLAVGVIVFAVIVAVQTLGANDDDMSTVGTPTRGATEGTLEVQGIEAPAGVGPVLTGPIDDGFVRRELASDEVPGEIGLLFVDIEEGTREFWSLPLEGRPGEDYFARYSADVMHRWLQLRHENADRSQSTMVIGDRVNGESYRLNNQDWLLVAGPTTEGLLIAQSRSEPGRHVVVDLASDPLVPALEFSLALAPGEETANAGSGIYGDDDALLLGDGETLLFTVRTQGNPEPSKADAPRLFTLNTRTGEVSRLGHAATDALLVSGTPDGGVRVVALDEEWSSFKVSSSGEVSDSRILNVGHQTPEAVYQYEVSPDGRWLTWQEQLPLTVQAGVGMPWHWPLVVLADLETGESVLRVMRVDPVVWLGDDDAVHAIAGASGAGPVVWHQWRLRDETGFLVKTPPDVNCAEQCIYYVTGSPGYLSLLRPDGSLEELSTVPDGEFAAALAVLPPGNLGLSADGRELRVEGEARAGRDFGGGVSSLPLPPLVQARPYADEARLKVDAGGDSLNVRVQPSTDAEVTATLSDGTEVAVRDAPCPGPEFPPSEECSVAIESGHSEMGTYWVHVSTEDGLSGWVSAEFVTWAD